MLYELLKRIVGVCFNVLNLLMAGNLPPLGCTCVVVTRDDRYLVIKRPEGTYAFPGGFMRWHEKPEQTARREGREETGLDLHIGDVVSVQSNISGAIDQMSTLIIAYEATVIGGDVRSSIEGEPGWQSETELQDKLEPIYQRILSDYQAQGKNNIL